MLARLFYLWRLKLAARRYTTRLPRQICADYGAAETYTPAQIRKSTARARLPASCIALGYAAFLTEDGYNQIKQQPQPGYDTLRNLIARHTPSRGSHGSPSSYESEYTGVHPGDSHSHGGDGHGF